MVSTRRGFPAALALAAALAMSVAMLMAPCAADAAVLETDVSTPSEGCAIMGVRGSFAAYDRIALDRLNEIRKEACREGVPDPRDGSRALEMADYVPLKWSSGLERIARIRAAEACVAMGHDRPNGKGWDSFPGYDVGYHCAEVLAWNDSESMVPGINQWYGEKGTWVSGGKGVTGHYTSMIDPRNTYVGIGSFRSDKDMLSTCVAGEFARGTGLDETMGSGVRNCIQKIEVMESALCKPRIDCPDTLGLGESQSADVTFEVDFDEYYGEVVDIGASGWRSSKPSVVRVGGDGKLTAVARGKATVRATTSLGTTASAKVRVTKPSHPVKVSFKAKPVKRAKVAKGAVRVGKVKVKGAKGKVKFSKPLGDYALSVDKRSGAVTVAKGASRGLHQMWVLVTVGKTAKYKKTELAVVAKVRVK